MSKGDDVFSPIILSVLEMQTAFWDCTFTRTFSFAAFWKKTNSSVSYVVKQTRKQYFVQTQQSKISFPTYLNKNFQKEKISKMFVRTVFLEQH